MTDIAHSQALPRRFILRDWMPWLFFCLGLFIVPTVFALGCLLSHPASDWDTSFFGRYLAKPLEYFGLCCCLLSPVFTRFQIWVRLLLALLGLVIYIGVFVACFIIAAMIFGLPDFIC